MQKPDSKVAAGGIAGAIACCLVWTTGQAGLDMPAEVGAGFATLIIFAASYIKRA